MKTFFVWFILALLLNGSVIFARPASSIELSYNQDTQSLHFIINHVSHNLREHHIRKVVVFKNDQEESVHYYPTQTTPRQLIDDIPIGADIGDVIRIKAICSEAGYSEESFTIPDEEPAE